MDIRARTISRGRGEGMALICRATIGFLGGVDPGTGIVIEKNHPLEGKSVCGRILVFTHGKGSTVGSYVMLQLARNGKAPAAIINESAEPIIAVGAIISGIPMVDKPEADVFSAIREGDPVKVNATAGRITVGEMGK